MAFTNETTHFGIPLPLGSDLTTPMDYNESVQKVDTTLFEAKTDSGSALQKANQLQQDLATTNDNVTAVTGRVTTLEGTTTTQGQAIIQNTQDIADVRADALDMIVAKDEGTAQVATVAVAKSEYFRYNDVLYIATSNIAIGDTIVPNENCSATNVGTELSQLNSDLTRKTTWISKGSALGTNYITLPDDYNEVHIVVLMGADDRIVLNILKDDLLPNANTYFNDGYYLDSTHFCRVAIGFTKDNKVTLASCFYNSTTNAASQTYFGVKYR